MSRGAERLFLNLLVLISLGFDSKAQEPSVLSPDESYYRCLQFLDPTFSVSSDTAVLRRVLFKQHSLTSALAQKAVETQLDTTDEVKKELGLILEIARKRYLAEKLSNSMTDVTFEVSKQEVIDFYNANLAMFSKPGKVSFVKAFYSDKGKESRAREMLAPYLSKLPKSWEDVAKHSEDGLLISSDFEIPLNDQQPFTKWFVNAKKGQIVGPIEFYDQLVLLLVVDITPTERNKLDEVYELCESWVRAEKRSKWMNDMEIKAAIDFPIVLPPR